MWRVYCNRFDIAKIQPNFVTPNFFDIIFALIF